MYEKSCASSNHIKSWKDIDFGTAEYEVKKLQMRIAKAVKENRVGKIKSLQWTLTHSFYAKAIAVKTYTILLIKSEKSIFNSKIERITKQIVIKYTINSIILGG